ncbi:phosphotyrosine protein phosphatase [Candidatus Woesearchaeota archaeon]|nr:phosphotyrosine protein phosphatase [Candidatus Woesearchaeota archaeon]
MHVLFLCNQGQHRAPTAAKLFSVRFETRSAGLYSDSPVTETQLAWADVIAVMEDEQRIELGKRFPKLYLAKKIVTLHISDTYAYGSSELIAALQAKADLLTPATQSELHAANAVSAH